MRVVVRGIKQAVKHINKLAKIREQCLEIAKRLCDVGYPWIWAWHGNHAKVSIDPIDNGYCISAEGEKVLFIEFGTGDSAGIYAQHYNGEVPTVVRPGSWSEQDAHMYERLHFWIWHGKWFRETRPHPAFYDAYRAMSEAFPQIVKEVLGTA